MGWRNLTATAALVSTTYCVGTVIPRDFPRVPHKPAWRTLFPLPDPKLFTPPPPPPPAQEAAPKAIRIEAPPPATPKPKPLPKPIIGDTLPALSTWRLTDHGTLEHLEPTGWVRKSVDGEVTQLQDHGSEIEIRLADGTRMISKDEAKTWKKLPL